MAKTSLRMISDRLPDLHAAMKVLAKSEVLVGFPEESTDRKDGTLSEPTNAQLGYIHDNGAPEQNIPARPFMLPGIASVKDQLGRIMGQGAKTAVARGSVVMAGQALVRAGITASTAIKRTINAGIPPPLADSTLRERERKRNRKGTKLELQRRAAGLAPSVEFAKPLIDTGQLRNAVTYVIRDRKKRKT